MSGNSTFLPLTLNTGTAKCGQSCKFNNQIYRSQMSVCLQAVKFIKQNLAISTDSLDSELLTNCAKTSMSSKIVGSDSDFFAKIAVEAIQCVKVEKDGGKAAYPVNAINVLKAHGKSMKESRLIRGYAIATGRASQVPSPFPQHQWSIPTTA